MLDWHFQSRAHQCQATGQPFQDGQSFHTVLLSAKEGYERLDLCAEAWNTEGAAILKRPEYVSHWRGTYHVPPPAPPETIAKDDAETLLRRLMELQDPVYGPAIYILAAMLERKRVLRAKQQTKDGGRRQTVYEQPKTGDIFVVTDPELQLHQLETVQRDVAHLLEFGLPQPEKESVAETVGETVGTELPEQNESDAEVAEVMLDQPSNEPKNLTPI
jgi:hypothetical protein